jgi:hypothetical protein
MLLVEGFLFRKVPSSLEVSWALAVHARNTAEIIINLFI